MSTENEKPSILQNAEFLYAVLETSKTNIIIADLEEKIIYANPRSLQILAELESELNASLPRGFRANKIIGGSIHRFHKDPDTVRRVLRRLRKGENHLVIIKPGKLTFSLNARPIFDAAGTKLGYVTEWDNLTAKIASDHAAARLLSSIEGSSGAMMTCDRNLMVTYANPATMKMLAENIHEFQKAFPGFTLEKFVGSNIDLFHKNPQHQRTILTNPAQLPYKTDVRIGNLTFQLNVTAMRDARNEYIGNTVEWSNVTELRAKEADVARLSGMIEEARTNFMVCDTDLKITYANPAVISMFRKYQSKIREAFPNFDADHLLGRCIDDFHANPGHQRKILGDVSRLPIQSKLTLAGLEFGLHASAVKDAKGNCIGNAVEWTDYNDRVIYSKEVDRLYHQIQTGHLSARGELEKVPEVYRPMIQNINKIIEAVVEPIDEIQTKLAKIATGDLNAFVTGDYQGDHALLKNALNNTLQSLGELSNTAVKIAEGDLTVQVIPKSEVDNMGKSMQLIVTNLNKLLGQVLQASEEIESGSSQIASASQNLAQGASSQASALEEITASMTQVAAQTETNAENANQANILATSARESANAGDAQMKGMITAMSEIDESSQNISKIIKVIDEIAFQTNLLALNAAVEAARAGVHGKGFAVVANEVRNLAGRSAKAAKETTDMIEDSTKRVQQGIDIANKTGQALTEIVSGVGKVTDLVGEIAAASREQAEGIGQINQGLRQIEQVTQANTSTSEETAASAEQLSSQSTHLKQMLSAFKIRREAPALPQGLTPELLQAVQSYLASQAGQLPGLNMPQAYAAPQVRETPPRGQKVEPHQIISLDDNEFGRF
ncbi:methyl-accepting chemotaxis protein [Deltaproteobacteria bacterium TL4]